MSCPICDDVIHTFNVSGYFNLQCVNCGWEQHAMYDTKQDAIIAYLVERVEFLTNEVKELNAWATDMDLRNMGDL